MCEREKGGCQLVSREYSFRWPNLEKEKQADGGVGRDARDHSTIRHSIDVHRNSRHLSHKFDLHTDALHELWSSCDFFLRHWQMLTRKISHGRLFRHISFQLSLEGTGEAEPILGMLQQMAT